MLKSILLVIVALIAIVLIAALFVSKEYHVEREITIARPRQQVFDYIRFLKNQSNYSKWVMMDPNAKMTYTGTDGAVGFTSAWDSDNKNVGKGQQTIAKITEGERLDLDLHFIKPFDGYATAYLATADDGPNTRVKWGFNGKMKYPMNIMLVFMNMDKMLGGDIAEGLGNLKKVMEK
jgi:uncharacterized protein YndB with AHSA1/START domain